MRLLSSVSFLLACAACTDPRLDPPEIARITPSTACGTGVATLLIEGNNFDPEVAIDLPLRNTNAGIAIASDQRAVLTERRAIVLLDQEPVTPGPGAPPVVHDVRMINPDGQEARLAAGFRTYGTFEVTGLTPNRGPAGNTVAVVMRGTGFHGPLTLQIGVGAEVVVEDIPTVTTEAANIAMRIPAGTRPGTYAIIVRNPGGCEVALDRAFTVE